MENDEVALEIHAGSEALRYLGKKCALIITLTYFFLFFYLVCNLFFPLLLCFFKFNQLPKWEMGYAYFLAVEEFSHFLIPCEQDLHSLLNADEDM